MKGVPVQTLRSTIFAFLDKVDALLKGEPVRLILYSAAAVVYATVYVLNAMGVTKFGAELSFEAAVALTGAAITLLVLVVERVRMFVFSPMTYIEDLADEAKAAHESAHAAEAFSQMNQILAAAKAAQTPKRRIPVGTVKAAGSKDQSN